MLLKNRKDYSKLIIGLPILFIFVTSIIIGGLNIYNLNSHHNHEIDEIKNNYIDKQKAILLKNIDLLNFRIDFSKKQMYKHIKLRIKRRVGVAHTIANTLYEKYKNEKTEDEIKEIIITALNKISWKDGKNYFRILDCDGVERIDIPHYKEFTGKNILNFKDTRGNFNIKEEINLVKTQKEGYLYNTSRKINSEKNIQFKQISYVKDLGFYDWYVETAEFIDENIKYTKKNLIEKISKVNFIGNNYLFIYDLLDINGGDKFAKMLVNKNRPDLIGKYLSDSHKDIKGKEYRKEFLEKISKKGFAWVEYHYKKPDGTSGKKLSYFYLDKKFNWIVANGFYYDDINKIIKEKESHEKYEIRRELITTFLITLTLASILSIFSVLLSRKIQLIMNTHSKELENLNNNLEERIKKEIDKNSKKDLMIFRQSKMATMGEMIGNIAHQWRQPLNSIGATMMKLEMINEHECNENKKLQKIVVDTNKSLQYMSKTIDDFRNFFAVNKEKEVFYAHEVINEAVSIIKVQFDDLNINLHVIDRDGYVKIYGHKNELIQVLLNLLNNAKDAIVTKLKKEIYKSKITIIIDNVNDGVSIIIKDNAGGIPQYINDKIFEPYFTTKFKSKGTGIGLYMSKMIIEKDMNGSITVENDSEGAIFTVCLSVGRG